MVRNRLGIAVAMVATVASALVVLVGAAPASAAAVVFTVNDLGDAADASAGNGTCATAGGVCTLRAAIQEASAVPANTYTVNFSVAGSIVTNGLPNIGAAVTIDGSTAPGYSVGGGPVVTVRRPTRVDMQDCLTPIHDDITIRGLRLVACQFAIDQLGGARLKVVGNHIGTNGTAYDSALAVGVGLFLTGADTVVGGSTAADRNVISGWVGKGMVAGPGATNLVVRGNYLGTNAAGTAAVKDTDPAATFTLNGTNTLKATIDVQGTTLIEDNVISSNPGVGIQASSATADVTIQGNLIGTDAAGTAALGNRGYGILVQQQAHATIGGTGPGDGNVISATIGDLVLSSPLWVAVGIGIDGATATIQGNRIGTNSAGTAALGNSTGVRIRPTTTGAPVVASSVTIGGTAAGAGNQISGNTKAAIDEQGSSDAAVIDTLVVQGNLIGTNAAGTAALGNGTVSTPLASAGISITGHTHATVGGPAAGARNVVSGNGGYGISVADLGDGSTVQGNLVGTNQAGTAALKNLRGGIQVASSTGPTPVVIGGTAAGAGNLVSGNAGDGVAVTGATVQGNRIGTNLAGTAAIANTGSGIKATGASTIGGSAPGAGNLVSGNGSNGLWLTGTGGKVLGNQVGVDAAGTGSLPNTYSGVFVSDSTGAQIGGVGVGEGNTLANSAQGGVRLYSATNVVARGNEIYDNVFPSIDLYQHDPQGKNNGDQLPPTLTTINPTGGGTQIAGTVTSDQAGPILVDVYASSRCNPKYGTGESKQLLGTITVPYAGGGVITAFSGTVASSTVGSVITATATVPNNGTSQYSTCLPASDLQIVDEPNYTEASVGTDVGIKVTVTNNGPTAIANLVLPFADPSKAVASAADEAWADAPSQGTIDLAAGSWTVGALASGASASVCVRADIARETYTATFPGLPPTDIPSFFGVEVSTEDSTVVDPYRGNNRTLNGITGAAKAVAGAAVCPLPALTIDDASATRPSTGTTPMTFTVRIPVQTRPVTVHYATSNGTAVAVEDYVATSGDLTIPAGQTTKTFDVPIVGNQSDEPDKSFTVTLSAPKHAKLGDATAIGTVKANHVLGGCPPGSTSVQRFVCHLYFDALGRAPETGGFNYWVGKLNRGTPRSTMAATYLTQPESLRKVADRAYVLYLGRHGTTTELTGWANKLKAKTATTQDIRIAVLASSEYYAKTGGTNSLYIQQMFKDVFRRSVDASGLAYWTGQLNAGKTRTNVATRFMAEPEGRRKIVGDIYLRFLRRDPSTAEANGWVDKLAAGKTEVDVGIGLVASTEYFNRPSS